MRQRRLDRPLDGGVPACGYGCILHKKAQRGSAPYSCRNAEGRPWNVCADVGSQAKVQHLDLILSRIPATVLSDNAFLQCGMDPRIRNKLRPDALILECNTPEDRHSHLGKRDNRRARKLPTTIKDGDRVRARKAYIIEVGYTSETRYLTKLDEKLKQHSTLQQLLQQEGYDPIVVPIILGTTGGIFNSNKQAFDVMGASSTRMY